MEFIIDRSKWRCGGTLEHNSKGLGKTRLLNSEGYMCCLGQVSKQLGCSDESLLFTETPYSINDDEIDKVRDVLLTDNRYHNNLSLKAIDINDDNTIIKEKEVLLKELFKEHGHSITFIGKAVKYKEV